MCQWNYLPNVVLLEGGGMEGRSFDKLEAKWPYWETNKEVNTCARSRRVHASGPSVDGRPQTRIVFIWTLTQLCLISLCYKVWAQLIKCPSCALGGRSWLNVACGLWLPVISWSSFPFSCKTCKLWSRQDPNKCKRHAHPSAWKDWLDESKQRFF